MSKKKGVPYPASTLQVYDVVHIDGFDFDVYNIDAESVFLSCYLQGKVIKRTGTVRLIRKAGGPTYETWQRRTSKLLKKMGLSRWPGAVMHQYFFDSVSPEEAAAGFMSDHFEIDFIPIELMEP